MKLTPWQKNIFSMIIIAGAGFILFNVAFILAFFVNRIFNLVIFSWIGLSGSFSAMNFLWHYAYMLLVLLISWLVFRSRFGSLVKAAYATMPLIVVLTELGIQLYRWPALVWAGGAVVVGAVLFCLYKSKCSWLYYFAVLFVVAVEIFVMVSGMEI